MIGPVAIPSRETAREPDSFSRRVTFDDDAETTAYVSAFRARHTELRVIALSRPMTLLSWCLKAGVHDAIVGGFFIRDSGIPIGEVRTRGVPRRSVPFPSPWDRERSCAHVEAGALTLAVRSELPVDSRGDLLQAGPLLVCEGRSIIRDGVDPEGFSAGSAQFDSDITIGRYPRAALGIGDGLLWAVVCDGRAPTEAGMTLAELASFMEGLGAETAINLDGGGSTSLVRDGALVNRPREEHGIDLPYGRPVSTALAFVPRV
jgi:hypothetical protein